MDLFPWLAIAWKVALGMLLLIILVIAWLMWRLGKGK